MSVRDDYQWLADQERFHGDTGAKTVLDRMEHDERMLATYERLAECAHKVLVAAEVIDDVPIHPVQMCVALDEYTESLLAQLRGAER